MSRNDVYRNGQLHVLTDRCNTCIFRPGNPMRLPPGRVKNMVEGALANESVIPCHSTIHGAPTAPAVCRGYCDAHRSKIAALRLAQALGIVTYVPPPQTAGRL